MKTEKDIRDDEIRVIGGGGDATRSNPLRWWIWGGFMIAVISVIVVVVFILGGKSQIPDEQTYFEPQPRIERSVDASPGKFGREVDSLTRGFIEIQDTAINDIPLCIYIPHNAKMSLHVGRLDKRDTSIIFAAQAADIRRDNRKIVGAFVLKGEPLAWGLSKKGYCAIINDKITIGIADNSPLFEQATETDGYFFRQYPLVDNGKLVENEPKNKSVRRALCDRNGEVMMVESLSNESFHDFAQALVDLGITNAIYLVGSSAYGWAVNDSGDRIEFGIENLRLPKNASYIVWRRR